MIMPGGTAPPGMQQNCWREPKKLWSSTEAESVASTGRDSSGPVWDDSPFYFAIEAPWRNARGDCGADC